MNIYGKLSVVIVGMALVCSACVSNMTMQTAEVLPQGKFLSGGAVVLLRDENGVLSQYSGDPEKELDADDDKRKQTIVNPWLMTRYGLGSGCDIGLNVSAYAIEGNFKIQMLNAGDFFLASGIGLYYGYRPDLIDPEPGVHSLDIIFPAFISYNVTDFYALYGSVKYTSRNLYSKRESQYIDGYVRRHVVSLTLGNRLKIFENNSLMFEVCINRDLGIKYYTGQISAGAAREF